ncbi:hypothetical protein [Sulfuricurvum sp.]|uniref:hypothetical protein n=1 Tax=Sulfuricurvum sp. TaxID=2025608 RepID=UPI0019C331CB|nr:hypothetical protein [Sulfuricurvum sp.]MBD3798843.1 hypothetical protein [Campylobacterota bacterium]MBD3806228.1 hypothetical protein [Sulfuricurvum sp.]
MSAINVFEADGKQIDLAKITRLYPAVLIHAGGESASVSLEWAEMKADQISIETYLLVCDFDPVGEVPVNRIELRYPTKEALLYDMQRIVQQLNSKN